MLLLAALHTIHTQQTAFGDRQKIIVILIATAIYVDFIVQIVTTIHNSILFL